jgi:hypothetical protein
MFFFFIFYEFLENKRVEHVLSEVGVGEVAQTIYTHVSKGKNGKIKFFKT